MRTIALFLIVLTVPRQSVAAQSSIRSPMPPSKVIAELQSDVSMVAPTLEGRRLYYGVNPDAIWVYDVASKRSTKIATMANAMSVSAQGNRIAFRRAAEGGAGPGAIWTIPLDPRTGLATGPARRVSLGNGTDPSLSPDGKWLAFASQVGRNHLAIIPSDGGAERIVFDSLRRIDGIQWSHDQKWLYFNGMRLGESDNTLQRVAVAGGKPVVLARIQDPGWAGLSPDGTVLASNPSYLSWQMLLDTAGKQIAQIPGVDAWLTSSELLQWNSHRRHALKAISLANGTIREVVSGASDVSFPAWAADGRSFAALSWSPETRRLLIANADGGDRRTIVLPLSAGGLGGPVWSPDGRWIALHDQGHNGILAVDVGSGKTQTLRTPADCQISDLRWTADSRHVRYVSVPIPRDSLSRARHSAVRDAGVDGSDVAVFDLPAGSNPWRVLFLSDTSAMFGYPPSGGINIRSLASDRTVRIFERNGGPTPSRRGDLFAMTRSATPGVGQDTADIVSAAGVHIATLKFPTALRAPGWFAFTSDNKSLVTLGWSNSAKGCCVLYVAPIDGGPVRTLLEFKGGDPTFSLSPDNKTILVTSEEGFRATFQSMNISALLRRPPKN